MCEIPGRNANIRQSCVTAADLYKRLEHSQCNVVVCFLTALGNFALMAVCSQYHSRDSIHARSVPGVRKASCLCLVEVALLALPNRLVFTGLSWYIFPLVAPSGCGVCPIGLPKRSLS